MSKSRNLSCISHSLGLIFSRRTTDCSLTENKYTLEMVKLMKKKFFYCIQCLQFEKNLCGNKRPDIETFVAVLMLPQTSSTF